MLKVKITKPKAQPNRIAVYLTEQEVELFKTFRKYQDDFEILIGSGFNNIKNGKMILHFNNGVLMKVDQEVILYKRKRETYANNKQKII